MEIATAVLSITATCFKAAKAIHDLYGVYSEADIVIAAIHTESIVIGTSLTQIQSLLLQDSDKIEKQLVQREDLRTAFDATLQGCMVIFSCLEKEIQKMKAAGSDDLIIRLDWKKRLRYVWRENSMKDLLQSIRGQQTAVSLLISLLQLKSQQDIQTVIQDNSAMLQHVMRRVHSLRTANPQISKRISASLFEPSVLDKVGRGSVIGDEDFDFDNVLVNSQAYRRVLAAAQNQSVPQATHIVEESESDTASFKSVSESPMVASNAVETSVQLKEAASHSNSLHQTSSTSDVDHVWLTDALKALDFVDGVPTVGTAQPAMGDTLRNQADEETRSKLGQFTKEKTVHVVQSPSDGVTELNDVSIPSQSMRNPGCEQSSQTPTEKKRQALRVAIKSLELEMLANAQTHVQDPKWGQVTAANAPAVSGLRSAIESLERDLRWFDLGNQLPEPLNETDLTMASGATDIGPKFQPAPFSFGTIIRRPYNKRNHRHQAGEPVVNPEDGKLYIDEAFWSLKKGEPLTPLHFKFKGKNYCHGRERLYMPKFEIIISDRPDPRYLSIHPLDQGIKLCTVHVNLQYLSSEFVKLQTKGRNFWELSGDKDKELEYHLGITFRVPCEHPTDFRVDFFLKGNRVLLEHPLIEIEWHSRPLPRVVARNDYISTDSSELQYRKDDEILVDRQMNNEWRWSGRAGNARGFFYPSNVIERVPVGRLDDEPVNAYFKSVGLDTRSF